MTRPLLVLDLDETLWHGQPDGNDVQFLPRPGLGPVLESVSSVYDLAVWTAASADWMHAGLNAVKRSTGTDLSVQAVFLWDRERCFLAARRARPPDRPQTCAEVPCRLASRPLSVGKNPRGRRSAWQLNLRLRAPGARHTLDRRPPG